MLFCKFSAAAILSLLLLLSSGTIASAGHPSFKGYTPRHHGGSSHHSRDHQSHKTRYRFSAAPYRIGYRVGGTYLRVGYGGYDYGVPGYGYYPGYGYPYPAYDAGFYYPGSYWPTSIYGRRYYAPFYYDSYYAAPTFLPAETLYGPQAVQRFLGINQPAQRQQQALILPANRQQNLPQPPLVIKNDPVGDGAHNAPLRVANEEARARARKFVSFGDAKFKSQRYHEAVQRYKSASEAAPNMAEPHFRQGHALVAMGQYEQAMKAYQRGLKINPQWAKSRFNFDDLYADDHVRNAVRERLAKAAIEDKLSPTPLYLLGIQLYFDRNPQRAKLFFTRARELGLAGPGINTFLKPQSELIAEQGQEF